MKILFNTDVMLAGLMVPQSIPGRILAACQQGNFEWICSEALAQELGRALLDPAISKVLNWNSVKVSHFITSLKFQASFVNPAGVSAELAEPHTAAALAALAASKANYLVTADKALLALAAQHPILSPADFWARFGH